MELIKNKICDLTVEMTCEGGRYEWMLQMMLKKGLQYIGSHPELLLSPLESTPSVLSLSDDKHKVLRDAMVSGLGVDMTNAIGIAEAEFRVNIVLRHMRYILDYGYGQWIDTVRELDPNRIFNLKERYPCDYPMEER